MRFSVLPAQLALSRHIVRPDRADHALANSRSPSPFAATSKGRLLAQGPQAIRGHGFKGRRVVAHRPRRYSCSRRRSIASPTEIPW